MIKYIRNIPKKDPNVDNVMVRIVPSITPKADPITLRLKDMIIANGNIGNIASKNGNNIPIRGANQKLFWISILS
jgi:hypothetical protein